MMPAALLCLVAALLAPWPVRTAWAMPSGRLEQLRKETVAVFYHGFSNYMQHAFPEDEIRPVSCTPLTRDRNNPDHFGLNDVLGNYSLTLIDSLSTLAILAGGPQEGPYTGSRALADFQNGIEQFVLHYGDGRPGPSGEGLRARGFDLDSKVQVFETVIRGVGGLLSAHLFAIGELPIRGYDPGSTQGASAGDGDSDGGDLLELPPIAWPSGFEYDGQLLRLALDLSERLLPAFYTRTGLPYPRVNLRHGIPFYANSPIHQEHQASGDGDDKDEQGRAPGAPERTDTCSAGAGSLVLEFTALSRLTGDPRFEQAAKRAFWAVYDRRSHIGLIGNAIDADTGQWSTLVSGIGAGVDSFFEYALKTHILLSGHGLPNTTAPPRLQDGPLLDPNSIFPPLSDEKNSADAFLRAWHKSHAAIKRHFYTDAHHPHYVNGHIGTGSQMAHWIDSLGAFYPGLLALAGELEEAIETQLLYTALWTRYSALPERWSVRDSNVEPGIGWWPGRPEFIESTYHIYRATGDPWYLYVGDMVLQDIMRRCYTECGWSGLDDVRTGAKSDRMESFFLGETTKYLYLLFDRHHPLNNLDAAYVFTTEGHPLIIPRKKTRKPSRRAPADEKSIRTRAYYDDGFTNSCPVPPAPRPLTGSATAARSDIFHAASLTGLHRTPNFHGELEAVDPPSDSEPDAPVRYRAKTNHTLFPWTLPPSMLPDDGVCERIADKATLRLEFPARETPAVEEPGAAAAGAGGGGAFSKLFGTRNVVRNFRHGYTVVDLAGLKMHLVLEEGGNVVNGQQWRVSFLENIPLGRDELVYIDAELVTGLADQPTFRTVRDSIAMEVVLVSQPAAARNKTQLPDSGDSTQGQAASSNHATGDPDSREGIASDSAPIVGDIENLDEIIDLGGDASGFFNLVESLKKVVTSVFDPVSPPPSAPSPDRSRPAPRRQVHHFLAALPSGPGAMLPPDVPDAPSVQASRQLDKEVDLEWKTVYLAGDACGGRVPDEAPRQNQVLVMRRGGCTFSEKLANIPTFIPGPDALQLVIVVDETSGTPDADGLWGSDEASLEEEAGMPRSSSIVQPSLERQFTPGGILRPHPIPLILLYGKRGTYEAFRDARSVGIRRKYFIQTQGIRVDNIQII